MDNIIEILRVLRTPPMGKLLVEIGGDQFEKLSDISDPRTRQIVMAAIGELVAFADGYDVLVSAGLAPPASGSSGDIAASMQERIQAFESRLHQQDLATFESSQLTVTPVETAAVPAEKSMVQQINTILQIQIAESPSLAQRKVKMEETSAGALQIIVDGTVYERPSDVEDPEIKAALNRALQAWNSSKAA